MNAGWSVDKSTFPCRSPHQRQICHHRHPALPTEGISAARVRHSSRGRPVAAAADPGCRRWSPLPAARGRRSALVRPPGRREAQATRVMSVYWPPGRQTATNKGRRTDEGRKRGGPISRSGARGRQVAGRFLKQLGKVATVVIQKDGALHLGWGYVAAESCVQTWKYNYLLGNSCNTSMTLSMAKQAEGG